MLAGGRNSRCNPLDDSPLSFALCVSFSLVGPHPKSARAGGGPRSCRGRPACWVRLLVAAVLAASVFFTAENFTVNKLFTPRV